MQVKFEANVLSLNPQLAAELQMLDDGSGSKKIWILKNTDIYLLDDNKYGQFHSQCCYVIEYKYGVNGVDNYIILYWIVIFTMLFLFNLKNKLRLLNN